MLDHSDGNYSVTTSFNNGDRIKPWSLPETFKTLEEAKNYAGALCYTAAEYDGGDTPLNKAYGRNVSEVTEKTKELFGNKSKEVDVGKSSDTEVTKNSFSSIGAAFYGNEKMTANEMERMLNDGSWKESEGYKKYLGDCVNVYKQAYGKATKSDIAQIEKEIEGIMRVAVAAKKAGYDILDNGAKRSTKDSKNRLLFSSLEPNSDYITSSDISAICDKRKTFTEIYDEIVRIEEANNVAPDERFFSKVDNYFILHKKMAEKGLVVPCEECYVESMRKNLAPMANAFITLVKETNAENKKNAQLYNQSGKKKGKLKENNAKIREKVIEICAKSNGTQEQIDKLKNLSADELAKFIDDVGSAENLGVSLDELTLPMLTTAEGLAKLKLRSPLLYEAFNSFYGQSKPKMPKEATPFRPGELIALFTDKNNNINQSLINKVKSTGGFRLQSYSDFQIGNFVDVLQTIFEASMLGLNGHAYTKVPAFLDATNGTNLKRNLSIFMYEDGGKWMLDKKNSFPMELDDIYALVAEDESGNTSIIAVSQNAKMSAWIMANDLVGYGIPFHKSGLKMDIVRLRDVKTPDGRTIKGYSNQIDHTKQQSEVYKYDKDGKKKNSKVSKPIDIYSFWDFENKKGLSKNELIEKNLKAYIDECEKAGYRPKFRDYVMNNDKVLKDVLAYSKELGFVSEDATIDDISFKYGEYTIPYGYYKFLGDFGMFTPEGEASPIKPLSLAEYDFDKAVGFFDDAKALREKELLQQFENGKVRDEYRQLLKEGKMTFEELQAVLEGKKNEVVREVVDGGKTRFALTGNMVGGVPTYTDQEYRDFGWARENDIITAGENDNYRSKFAMLKSGLEKYRKTKRGEYIIPAYDQNDPELENINSVLVFAKGTIDKPIITSIIRIYSYNELEIDKIRRYIYDCERRGVQPKTGELFDRYDATDFAVRPQISASSSGYSSGDELYRSGSSSKNNRTDEQRINHIDTEYLELAKNPEENEARLREMVEEAAKKAMPKSLVVDKNGNLLKVYHGSAKKFTEFLHKYLNAHGNSHGRGFYFTENKALAEGYATEDGQLLEGYLNIEKPLSEDKVTIKKSDLVKLIKATCEAEAKALAEEGYSNTSEALRDTWVSNYTDTYSANSMAEVYREVADIVYSANDNDVEIIAELTNAGAGNESVLTLTRDILGYDGVIYTNDLGYHEYVALVSNQFKSADPVTYDDNGNIIPLSQRFNSEKNNINFSEKDTGTSAYDIIGEKKALEKRYNKLAADFANYKERVKLDKTLTKGKVIDPKQLEAVARYLVKFADSDYKASELAKMLNDLYVDIQDGAMDDSMSWDEMYSKAYEVAKEIRSEAKIKIERPALYDKILKDIRSARIAPNDGQKGDAKHRFGEHYVGKFRGRVTIANDGTPLDIKWSEWVSKYPSVFDKDIGDAQQLVELYDIYDDLRNAGDVVQEYEESEVLQSLATEIINKAWTVTKFESTADKNVKAIKEISDENERRIKELDAQHRKDIEELRASFGAEIESLNRQALNEHEGFQKTLADKDVEIDEAKLADDMYYGRKIAEGNRRANEVKKEAVKSARADERTKADRRVDEAKFLDNMYYGRLLAETKRKRQEDVRKAKEAGRERLAQYRENAERKSVIQTITGDCLRLNKMLVTNSKDLHIHEALKGPVMELLTAIDFSSKRMLDKGIPTQKDISLEAALTKVKDMMKDASDGDLDLVHLYGHNLDEDIKKMMESVTAIRRSFADNEFVLQRMSLDDLVTLKKIVKTIKSAVNKLNEFHIVQHAKGIAHLSQESIEYLDSLGRGKIFDGIRGKLDKTMVWNNTLPYYAFKRYGEGGTLVYEALMDGWDRFAFNIDEIMRFTQSVYTDKEVDAWDVEVKTFKIAVPATEAQLADPDYKPKFQEVQMTVSQIMSLYCLQKREQAHKHLLEGGIRVDNFKKKNGEIVTQEDGAVLTAKDIETIISSLSVRQRAVADKLQEFLNTVCSDWGNEVSMARFGTRQFGEVYYFPIKSDDANITQDEAKEEADSFFKLLGASFAKGLTEGANNRIVISNIFDVFAKHTSDMAKYNALALPVLDAFRWYNYKGKEAVGDEGAFISYSLKQSMKRAYGDDGLKYFTQFLKDINGTKTVSRDTLGGGFIKNDKIASVGANLRVIFLQPTSYVRASAVIDNKYLTKALTFKDKARGKAADMAEKYCGIALWKSLGYYDTNVQQGVTDQIKHKSNWHDRATDLSMKGASMADRLTWGLLWNACELEIRDTRKDLKVGSEEFYKAISKRLREVIYATQVVDSTMTRSQMMRSGDKLDKLTTSFMSEPTLSYNMVLDAVMDIKLESRRNGSKNAWKKYGWKLARTAYAYTMTNALAALIETAFDAYRDDDDEEKDLLDYVKRYFANFAEDMSIVGKIPILKDALSIIQGYGASYSVLAGFEGLYKAVTQWWKIFTTDKGNPATALKNTLKALSSISGLPFYNVYRDVSAGLDKFFGVEIKELLNDLVD